MQSNPEAGQASVPTEQSENPTVYQSGPTSSGNSQTGYNSGQTSSVADILAAVSEQASQKCGYTYDEATGMYYDHRYAMYYDQVGEAGVEGGRERKGGKKRGWREGEWGQKEK